MEQQEQPRLLQRRVATAPTLLQPLPKTSHLAERSEREVDTIFHHANAKVISLVALSNQTFSLESTSRDTIGPWQSHFERTIAIGSLRLYRAPGSVAFLSCGSVLQPIFPKSQCWSMEENGSKFILQIRPPSYWRIELAPQNSVAPVGGTDTSLRDCFESVLLLDKTPCPFKESVPISLPAESLSVKKRRPWKPLRSYPSEPILTRDGEICGDTAVPEEGLGKEPITEAQNELDKELAQGVYDERAASDQVITTPEPPEDTTLRSNEGVKMSAAEVTEGDNKASAIDEHALPITCRETAVAAKKKEAISHPQPIQDTLAEASCTDTDEKRDVRRRYTIGSSWHDAEMDALIQTTSKNLPEGLKGLEEAAVDESSQNEIPTPDQVMVFENTLPPPDVIHQVASGQGQRPRLRRKEPTDRNSCQMTETEKTRLDNRSDSSNMPSKTIVLLFYAVFGILILAFKTVAMAIIGWWRAGNITRYNETRQEPSNAVDQQLEDDDMES
ncbi:hypothetical protein NLG97_g71 [Lecanicillium saksenae]|uniref:Uncharacterized protein n=1 Tax=Lecanicillium saksenae TaxID=468837 RepID=A0ACC1R920_9HYPO|nr:hypothetical protein NLG97_g71 [Lecanicillium saksenae]